MDEQKYRQRLERLYSNLNYKLEIYREGKQREAQEYEKYLEMFFLRLSAKLDSYRKAKGRWDRFLSTDFNVVSEFIIINKKYFRREDRLSDIIKCLLDANGSHGQGSKFLDSFLKRLYEKKHFDTDIEQRPCFLKRLSEKKRSDRVAELSDKQRQVKREDLTNQRRRIDITVGFEGFEIGIENKPWTHESNDQLKAYYSHLKDKPENEEFCLVFITPNGTHPTTICKPDDLIRKGELYCLSYRSDILEWLEECWQLCESDRFRWFLRDFRDYIRDPFHELFTIEENDDANE